ncbi:hypothetical protein CLHUN_39310 [Ruminiclostridium hungatei]|uniref:NfeD-like C-terminal domain-containing protein n=1 Tax=Ruminiclostridium hungatei TaxID=48256 RepID=A0A1V4SFA4_RUMHU|nr:NfeD family protein [Ruminiclostridium hungatei]OPX42145.1 hypothetical protein CLHUN_39310 [Ruminiclostridium hungatei]
MSVINLLTSIDPVAAVCFLLGLVLVIFEMFHPGLSFPGILGGILIIVGVVLTAKTIMDMFILIILVLAVLAIALTIVVHSATKGHLSKVLVLSDSLDKEVKNTLDDDLEYFLGNEGVTLTPLRPAGSADFDGVHLDVISDGGFIEKGRRVKISRMQDRIFVVKEIE